MALRATVTVQTDGITDSDRKKIVAAAEAHPHCQPQLTLQTDTGPKVLIDRVRIGAFHCSKLDTIEIRLGQHPAAACNGQLAIAAVAKAVLETVGTSAFAMAAPGPLGMAPGGRASTAPPAIVITEVAEVPVRRKKASDSKKATTTQRAKKAARPAKARRTAAATKPKETAPKRKAAKKKSATKASGRRASKKKTQKPRKTASKKRTKKSGK